MLYLVYANYNWGCVGITCSAAAAQRGDSPRGRGVSAVAVQFPARLASVATSLVATIIAYLCALLLATDLTLPRVLSD